MRFSRSNYIWLFRLNFSIKSGRLRKGFVKIQLCLLFWLLILTFTSTAYSTPSTPYFQQQLHYDIDVELDVQKKSLRGVLNLLYINHSPDSLQKIYFHLWPNAYKNLETPFATQLRELDIKTMEEPKFSGWGYMDSLHFLVNNQKSTWQFLEGHPDICLVQLLHPLLPGDSAKISTPFKVKIPQAGISRMGYQNNSFQITQWYPKPAVYDNNGWHPLSYLHQGEFYSEYGSFDVRITLPAYLRVASTGTLIDNPLEEKRLLDLHQYTERWLATQLQNDSNAGSEIETSSKELLFNRDSSLKTVRFVQNNVHDFAWFADSEWLLLQNEIKINDSPILTHCFFYEDQATLWKKSPVYLENALRFYSEACDIYPYDQMSIVEASLEAGAGMEYPTLAVIGSNNTPWMLENTIVHETGHQWFYGILGSNERKYPWMDESINSYYQMRYYREQYPEGVWLGLDEKKKLLKTFGLDRKDQDLYYYSYLLSARAGLDQAVNLSSEEYSLLNYGNIVYMKGALCFSYLSDYLGKSLFDSTMRLYTEKWKFKHPGPSDLHRVFATTTGESLNWFFDTVLATDQRLDYAIEKVDFQKDDKTLEVQLKNKGRISPPVSVSLLDKNNETIQERWLSGFDHKESVLFQTSTQPHEVHLDLHRNMPEYQRGNNHWKKGSGKIEKVVAKPIFGVEDDKKSQVFFTPLAAWNLYNKFMLGMAFYNTLVPQQHFEYVVAPLYSFLTNTPNGYARFSLHLARNRKIFKSVKLSVLGSTFAFGKSADQIQNYYRIDPVLSVDFRKRNAKSKFKNSIILRTVSAYEDYSYTQHWNHFYEAQFINRHDKIFHPKETKLLVQFGDVQQGEFLKTQFEFNYNYEYNRKGKFISLRLFSGLFLMNNTNHPRYNFRMDGISGAATNGTLTDYMYDYIYLGRSEVDGFLSKQFIEGMGGFKTRTPIGQSNSFLTAVNVKVESPFILPIGVFADMSINSNATFAYDAGIHAWVKRGFMELYVPFLFSQNIRDVPGFEDDAFYQRIRFVLNINKLNPYKIINALDI